MATTIMQPSIQALFLEMKFDDHTIASGTGFVLNSTTGHVLITNRHNVTGRNNETDELLSKTGAVPNRIEIHHRSSQRLGDVVSADYALFEDDRPIWIEHPVMGARADFVALRLADVPAISLHPFDLNEGNDLAIGPSDIVSVVGFPYGKRMEAGTAVWATGFIASEPDLNYDHKPIFLIDCRTRQGQSGSPVIAHRNGGAVSLIGGDTGLFSGPQTKLLGIYSGRISPESDLGIVWKLSAIKELLASLN